jgi:GAF domain-containing protein
MSEQAKLTQAEMRAAPAEERPDAGLEIPVYFLSGGAFILAIVLIVGVYIPSGQFDLGTTYIAMTVAIMIATGISLAFNYFGRIRIAATIYLLVSYLIALGAASQYGGLNNPVAIALFFTLIPIASLYFGRLALYITGAVLFATVMGIFFAGQIGLAGFGQTDIDESMTAAIAMVVTVLVQDYAATRIRRLFENVSRSAQELTERNEELTAIRENLERIVLSRTADLERRSRYLEATADIARDTNSILDPDVLLQRVVTLIAQKFGFYHVAIFLIDDQREWAVMRSASSVGGQQMIARNHRLSVGKQGIVGYVTGLGKPRIAQKIGLDYVHTTAEELPETQSEMAMPLKAHGEIIGALDIQDTAEQAFRDEDITILQTLADQIALAISNAQLYQQAQMAVEEVRRASGESSRRSWQEAQTSGKLPAYRYSRYTTAATRMETGALPDLDLDAPNKVEIPIQVRGHTIGTIDIVRDEAGDWEEAERELLQTLSEQLGVALDSARLFDESQQRAANERLVSEITTSIRESLDLETILRNAAQTIHQRLDLPQVTIRLADLDEKPNANGTNGKANGKAADVDIEGEG